MLNISYEGEIMVEQFLQALLATFSLRLLYVVAGWFLFFGYAIHLFIVQVLTGLPVVGVMRTVAWLHVRAVLISFFLAPCMAALTLLLFGGQQELFEGQFVFVWYLMIVAYVASYFFCTTFATIRCNQMRRLILLGNLCIGALGYLVCKALGIIVF